MEQPKLVIDPTGDGAVIDGGDNLAGQIVQVAHGAWAVRIHAYDMPGLEDKDNEYLHAYAPSYRAAIAIAEAFYVYTQDTSHER